MGRRTGSGWGIARRMERRIDIYDGLLRRVDGTNGSRGVQFLACMQLLSLVGDEEQHLATHHELVFVVNRELVIFHTG